MSASLPSNAVQSNGVGSVSDAELNTFVQTDQTVAQLRRFVGVTGMAVIVQGLSAPGDGGGALFYWSVGSYTDNNSTIIVPSAAAGKGAWLVATLGGSQGGYLPLTGGTISGAVTFNGAVSGTGINALFAAPPGTLGGTTPGAAAFTTLTASGSITGAGWTSGFASPPNLGSTAPGTGAFTTLTSTGGALNGTLGAITPAAASVTNLTISGTVTGPGLSIVGVDYLAGMILSNDGSLPNSVIDITAGAATDSTNTVSIVLAAFTKSTAGSFLAGTGNHGMGTGLTVAINTWYHVFAVIVAGTPDVYFDTSVTAANKPASTTAFRRIGSFLTDGSAHIIAFLQDGDYFWWIAARGDVNTATLNGSAALFALSAPLGVNSVAQFNAVASNAGGAWAVLLSAPDLQSSASNTPTGNVSLTNTTNVAAAGAFSLRTNTSSQIRAVASAGSTTLQIATTGWIDTRGKTFG